MNRIRLQNFQGHEDSLIELSDTITALTGLSHHGKSSFVRAVGWNRENKPKNPRFIRKGTEKSIVTIDTVRHERTEKTNKYFVEGKKDPFTALRGAIPEEVVHAMGIGPVNIQRQHDPIFLLDDTPGKVAQKLSELVDLDATTTALKYIAQRKRQETANAEVLRKSLVDAESSLEKLKHVDAADAELAVHEAEEVAIEKLKAKHTKVSTTIANAVQAKYELSKIPDTSALEPARKIQKKYNEVVQMNKDYEKLERSLARMKKLKMQLAFDPNKLLKQARRMLKNVNTVETVETSIDNLNDQLTYIVKYKNKEAALQTEKDKLLEGACPLCGRSDEA